MMMTRNCLTAALLAALCASTFPALAASSVARIDSGRLGASSQTQMAHALQLDGASSLVATTPPHVTARGSIKTRAQQLYQNVPVYGRSVVLERDGSGTVVSAQGIVERNLAADLASTTPRLSASQAQQALMVAAGVPPKQAVDLPQADLFVYPGHNGGKARLIYRTSFVIRSGSGVSRPTAIIDATTGQVIRRWEGLTSGRRPNDPPPPIDVQANGPGGNRAVGSYRYGDGDAGHELLAAQQSGATCYMRNQFVTTYNLGGGQRPVVWTFGCAGTKPAHYTSSGDAINGGYSPINDAHHFGGVVHDMYTSWFDGEPPLKNKDGSVMNLHMWVHYGVDYQNAYWDGAEMTFGDGSAGGQTTLPFVVLDVTGHEISHGYTEQHSMLEYTAQSGGMNEAFSDMAGEAVKYFDRGGNDFLVGKDLINPKAVPPGGLPALRDMCLPSRDGASIDSADQYYDGIDPHYSSGVYNRAFCLLAKTGGWNTRMAFEVFHDANQMYWQPEETYAGGACGVERAAADRGYSQASVIDAFSQVKVTCDTPESSN